MRAIWNLTKRPTLTFFSKSALHVVETEPVTKGQSEGGGRRPEEEEEVTKFLGKTIKPDHKFYHVIGICPECGRRERVNRTGLMTAHKISWKSEAHCVGTRQPPSKIVARYDW